MQFCICCAIAWQKSAWALKAAVKQGPYIFLGASSSCIATMLLVDNLKAHLLLLPQTYFPSVISMYQKLSSLFFLCEYVQISKKTALRVTYSH